MPITWQNINAPSMGAANLLLQSGANRISEGIEGLRNIANDRAAMIQDEQAQLRQRNTDTILGEVMNLSTMEDYNNAVNSDVFGVDALRERFGNNVDLAAVRNALASRDNDIMEGESQRFQYENAVQSRQDAPLVNDFTRQLMQATTPEAVDAITSNLGNTGLSNAGQVTALRSADEYKQTLLSRANAQTERSRNDWRFGRDVLEASRSDEDRFVETEYNPEEFETVVGENGRNRQASYYPKLRIQQEGERIANDLAALPNKYKLPDNFDDVIASGTATDAINEFMQGQDKEEVDATNVQESLLSAMREETFQTTNGQSYTYNNLPKWVVRQALGEIGEITNSWRFNDFGRANLTDSQKTRFSNALRSNLETYSTLTTRYNTMQSERNLLITQRAENQAQRMRFERDAREEFRRRNRPAKRNM